MFIYILLAIPSLFLLWVLITYVEHLISLRKYPKGPFPLPLIGNLNLLSKDLHLNFLEIGKTYGDVFSVSIGKDIFPSPFGSVLLIATVTSDRPLPANVRITRVEDILSGDSKKCA